MENQTKDTTHVSKRTWNKNKLIGQKSPLTPPQVWAIRVTLQLPGSNNKINGIDRQKEGGRY